MPSLFYGVNADGNERVVAVFIEANYLCRFLVFGGEAAWPQVGSETICCLFTVAIQQTVGAVSHLTRTYVISFLNVYAALVSHETILEAEHCYYYCHNTLQRWVRHLDHPERLDQPDDRRDHDSHHDRSAHTGRSTADRGRGVRLRLSPRHS